jgi:hypothetical protein
MISARFATACLYGQSVRHVIILFVAQPRLRHYVDGLQMCAECMSAWADISITRQMEIVGLDDAPMTILPSEMECRCPMCRTVTTAAPDRSRERSLRRQYPQAYRQRELDEQTGPDEDSIEAVETLTLYIGNTHHLVKPDSTAGAKNTHNWKFFVRPSRTDLIEEVQVFLVRELRGILLMSLTLVASDVPEPAGNTAIPSLRDSSSWLGHLLYLRQRHPQSRLSMDEC